jgi:hypothetical protein
MATGPVQGLEVVDAVASERALRIHPLLPAVRGDLLAKLTTNVRRGGRGRREEGALSRPCSFARGVVRQIGCSMCRAEL